MLKGTKYSKTEVAIFIIPKVVLDKFKPNPEK